MKKTAIVMLALASFGLSGCYTTASPEGVLRSAYKALQKNDVKKFPKFFTAEAKLQHGSLKGMADLQEQLAPYSQVEIGEIDLIETTKSKYGRDTRRVYSAQVMGFEGTAFQSVLTATVDCRVSYRYDSSCGPMHGPYPPYYGPYPAHSGSYGAPYNANMHYCGPAFEREQMRCLISKLD